MPTVSKGGRTGPRMEIVRRSSLLAFIEAREGGAKVHPDPPELARRATPRVSTIPVHDPYGIIKKKDRPVPMSDSYNLMKKGR